MIDFKFYRKYRRGHPRFFRNRNLRQQDCFAVARPRVYVNKSPSILLHGVNQMLSFKLPCRSLWNRQPDA